MFELPQKRPLIMGIINITPDSFSGDGMMAADDYVAAAVAQAGQMLADGADILDIGGESSRPGAVPVSLEEELHRVLLPLQAIRVKYPAAIIAIDTVKAEVARAALAAGAAMINDITAMESDAQTAAVVAEYGAYAVLMHNSARASDVTHDAKLGGEYKAAQEGDIVAEVKRYLMQRVEAARAAGIKDKHIILDAGIGFGKSLTQNLALISGTAEIRKLGFPVLVGPSRKSFIGRVLDSGVDARLEGTAAAVSISAYQGADILRVHDVKFMARVAKMAAAFRG